VADRSIRVVIRRVDALENADRPDRWTASMDLRQIRCFAAVYEEGSFSRAAKREHCTQPGLSVQIRRLEEMLEQRLFDRNARGVTPTIAGKHFYACCTDILGSVKAARQRMLDLAGRVAGRINIGVPPSFSKIALPAVLGRYAQEYPHVEVRLAEAYSGTLSQWVVAGELEIAIVTEPPADLGLESTRFFRDRLVLVGAPHLPNSASAPRRPAPSALKLVIPSGRHSLRQKIESHDRFNGSGVGRVMEIDGLTATLELVAASDWSTILPTVAVADDVRAGRLVASPIVEPDLWLDYFVVQTKDRPVSVASRRFLNLMGEELRRIAARWDARQGSRKTPATERKLKA
jgi:DNA-binding transcriptional LysR family regulator